LFCSESPTFVSYGDDDPVNTAPTTSAQTFSVAKNAAVNTEVGTVQTSGENGGKLTFSITDGNTSDAFQIAESARAIIVKTATALNFETTPAYHP